MGRGFTSGGQELGSVFSAAVCKYRLVSATSSPYRIIKEAGSLKVKGLLYSCL